MDPQRVRELEALCTEEQPPACTTACPLHVDARALVEKVARGDLAGGLAILARFVPLPRILAYTCERPCESSCVRAGAGGAVRVGALERACARHGGAPPTRRRQAPRGSRVAVVGGGLSSVTAAIDLAGKGHDVELFEAGPRLLARLAALGEQVLPAAVVDSELAVLAELGVTVRCGARVGAGGLALGDLVSRFDAVYLGVGAGDASALGGGLALTPDRRLAVTDVTFATSDPKVFAGGSHRHAPLPYSTLRSMQDGLYAALSIDRLLQGASLSARRESQGSYVSRLHVDTRAVASVAAEEPADPARGYTREEAAREAARCLPCRCLACVKACAYLEHHGSYPRRYVREIYNNDCIVMGAHQANHMVNSCTLCGLCAEVCPEHLPMAEVALEARRSMVARGKMPPSAHAFALSELAFSQGESFALARHEPGFDRSAAVFFPGCQLCGSSPDHVVEAYARLRAMVHGGVGLVLGCCGAPARWAGRQDAFDELCRSLGATVAGLGATRVVTACTSCQRMLAGALPGVSVESLWTLLEPTASAAAPRRHLALHDPCASRDDHVVQAAVRRLLAAHGVDVVELNEPGLTTCCGFGGLARFVAPEVTDTMVDRRAAVSDADYVTYCAMCRDAFAQRGKRAVHVLDVLFGPGDDAAARPDPGFSQRRENRGRLKARLLREVFGERPPAAEAPMELEIAPEVRARMERRLIVADDVRAVITHAERTGARLEDERTGRVLASHRPVEVTFWVEYSRRDGGFVVHNAYSHRMQVT